MKFFPFRLVKRNQIVEFQQLIAQQKDNVQSALFCSRSHRPESQQLSEMQNFDVQGAIKKLKKRENEYVAGIASLEQQLSPMQAIA